MDYKMVLNTAALVMFIIAIYKQGGIFPKSEERIKESRPYVIGGWVFLIAYFLL
jgi:hypothetical protein